MRIVLAAMMVWVGIASPSTVRAEDNQDDWVRQFYPELAPRVPPDEAPDAAAPAANREVSSPPVDEGPSNGSSPPQPWLRLELGSSGFRMTPTAVRRSKRGLSRGAKIGLGIGVPIFVIGVGVGAGAAAFSNNLDSGFN